MIGIPLVCALYKPNINDLIIHGKMYNIRRITICRLQRSHNAISRDNHICSHIRKINIVYKNMKDI